MADPLRVSLVSPYNPRPTPGHAKRALVGGVERALDATAEALRAAGADVTIRCTSNVPGSDVRPSGVRVERVRRLGALHRAPLSRLPFSAMKDADVVHVPATYPTVSDLVPFLARVRGVPCVLDYHFDVHGTSASMRVLAGAYAWTLAPLMRAARRVLVKTEDYAATSSGLARFPKSRVRVVPNGVDVERFGAAPAPGSIVLCVGRLVPYKGVDVLVRAMAVVQKEFPIPLVVAGDGPERSALVALASRLGVRAEFLGFVPDEALPGLYASARVTVLPSVNGQEAFGITLLESMASGTPVVASDLPGVRHVARLGGLTAPPGDADGLAAAIRAALSGSLPRGRALRARVEAAYSWGAVAQGLLGVYREVVEEA